VGLPDVHGVIGRGGGGGGAAGVTSTVCCWSVGVPTGGGPCGGIGEGVGDGTWGRFPPGIVGLLELSPGTHLALFGQSHVLILEFQ